MKLLTLSVVAVLAACNKAPANNVAAAANTAGPQAQSEQPANAVESAEANGQSAMPAGLDCVRNRLSPEQRQGVVQAAMEQASQEDPRAQALIAAVDACADELSWSPDKKRLAGMFSMSAAGATGIRQALSSQGIQVQALDEVILSDRALMMAAENNQMNSETGRSFAARHRAELERVAGGRPLDGELGMRIGNYIAFIAMAQTLSAQYAHAS
ncbi:hypothetical protein [Allosphingosinicella sp.]|uniref:hypothetical protein n=1 Tax=Allosphingosinicella sp. TaxID=2823234 RepID=UPI003784EAAC